MPVSPSTMENGLERSIKLASQPFDVAFHPGDDSDIVAAGLISGSLELYAYSPFNPPPVLTFPHFSPKVTCDNFAIPFPLLTNYSAARSFNYKAEEPKRYLQA